MTTISLFGVAGPFQNLPGERIEPLTEYVVLDKVNNTPLVIPPGNVVTEIEVRRRADVVTNLTPGRAIAVGYHGFPRAIIDNPGIATNILNQYNPTSSKPYRFAITTNPYPNASFSRTKLSFNNTDSDPLTTRTIVLQSSFGGNITSGGLSVIIKYKPLSESITRYKVN